VSPSCVIPDIFNMVCHQIQRLSLLVHHMRHVAEQLIELRDRLFNVPDLRFTLDDQRFLEVDLILRRQS
jgi:hypothetical protein